MTMDRIPIRTAALLDALDEAEMIEGYTDGRAGEAEPGDNRSFSYWHGWRNGATDGGYRDLDDAQCAMAHDVVESRRAA